MTTECTTERLEFERFRRQRVVGRFDGGELGSDGGGLLLREAADGAVPAVECVFPGSPRPAADAASGGSAGGSARAGAGAGLRGLDRSRHVAPEQAVVAAVRGGGTGPAQGELGGFAAGQEHAEPDGADGAGAGRRGTLQEDRGGHRAAGCPAGGPVPGLARGAAGADRAGRGRDGRSPARPPGRPLLPWVLSQLLLLAALYLLRPAVAGGAPADGGPGRGGWHGGGAGAHRGADPEALARGRDLAARGQRVLPRRIAGLVRGAGGGVCAGNRAEPALETEPGSGAGAGPAGMRADGAGGAGVQGLPLPDAGQLELFADRTSAQTMRANQLRLYFASFAYALLELLRRWGLFGQVLARLQSLPLRC